MTLPNSVIGSNADADRNFRSLDQDIEQLHASTNAAFRNLSAINAIIGGGVAAGTPYLFGQGGGLRTTAAATGTINVLYIDPADYEVARKTPAFRLRAQTLTNATAPAVTFTYGLYEITACAGAGGISYTLAAVTSGSTVTHTTPALSTRTQGSSGDFTIASAGYYTIGVVTSGATAANSVTNLSAQLQARAT